MRPIAKEVYSNIRRISSDYVNGVYSKMVFLIGNKPSVRRDSIDPIKKFSNGEEGGLIISADFEMAWAWRFTKTGHDHIKKAILERKNLPKLLEIFERYNIPITFATVGHLFLKQCNRGDHEWMSRINHFDGHWRFVDGDWFQHDPYSNYEKHPEWYAPDLVRMILDSPVKHEIASHTFSHIDFSYKYCSTEIAVDELKACESAASSYGVTFKSFVFPGGRWGNIEALEQFKYQIYRRNVKYDLAYPFRDSQGLLITPSSACLEYNLAYRWSSKYFINRLKKYIDKAIATNTVAHFWFHPSLNPYFLEEVFPGLLEYVEKQRDIGKLWVGTMKNLAEHINSNELI